MDTSTLMTYGLRDHVQVRVSGNLFTGAIYALDPQTRAYGINAELPQGMIQMRVEEADVVRKLGEWNPDRQAVLEGGVQ